MTAATLTWPLAALGILGAALVGIAPYSRRRLSFWGHVAWVVANSGWVIVFACAGQYPPAAMFAAYLLTAIAGAIGRRKRKWDPIREVEVRR